MTMQQAITYYLTGCGTFYLTENLSGSADISINVKYKNIYGDLTSRFYHVKSYKSLRSAKRRMASLESLKEFIHG